MESETKAKKKRKGETPESEFRRALFACSKSNDLSAALALYESAAAPGSAAHLSAVHYNTLLHVISAALESLDAPDKPSAIDAAFEIFDRMLASGAWPTEATVTSMARVAAQRSDGSAPDLAFEMVKTMGEKYGSAPKLRTYGPALFGFCGKGEAEKAYAVEAHMASMGVSPEEPELAALLEVSVECGNAEKVYEYLHKLRSSVGCVATSTAEIVERWFKSERAAEVGRVDLDSGQVMEAVSVSGGGWHGLGWLGSGPWEVGRTSVGEDGECSCCGVRLVCVDIDREETERFAELVAALAMERKGEENFRSFQEWLENHTTFEAVIDGANVGFYQQNFVDGGFSLSQLDTVVRELFQRSEGKWPLIILHSKRVRELMEKPPNKELLDTWSAKGALYKTPYGSNDDWYWLYAAVKLRCLVVTNDEMRDHIFELPARNFFPKWKERHQVRYTFVKGSSRLVMPPPYSLAIQESDIGSWHVPSDEKCDDERQRSWRCITRASPCASSNQAHPSTCVAKASAVSENMHTVPAENNGMQISSNSMLLSIDASPVTGKRKDRSPSPSEQLS